MWKVFPVVASLAQLLGTPLKQSTLNHSAAEFETSNTTHTTRVESLFFLLRFFMRTQNQQPTQTVAALTSPPAPYSHLSYTPPPLGNYPNPGIAWDAWRALRKLCCAPATCLYYDIDLLSSLISGRLQPHPSYSLPLFLFPFLPVGSCGSHRNYLATTLSKRKPK